MDKENVPPLTSESDRSRDGSFAVPKPPSIEDFEIVKPISRGAFGKVFLGYKKNNPRKLYAIKVMKKEVMINKNMTSQVIAERDALAVTKSPFVVKLYYSLQSKQNIYLVMEYMIGGDLKSLLAIYGYFDEAMAIMYVAEVTVALEYLHKHGIVHRDLKPDNMLITHEGHIKLTDFGLSKISLNRQISIGDVINTPSIGRMNHHQDYFRTPGQLLSLTSSLAFNSPASTHIKRPTHSYSDSPLVRPRCSRVRSSVNNSLQEVLSDCTTPATPRDRVFSVASKMRMTPPVISLTPTLKKTMDPQDSQTPGSARRDSVSSYDSRFHRDVNTDSVSKYGGMRSRLASISRSVQSRPDSVSKNNACNTIRSRQNSISSYDTLTYRTSSVASGYRAPSLHTPQSETVSSHASATEDDTPHLHRSMAAITKSYAARNLKSMREGSFGNDTGESGLQEESHSYVNLSGINEISTIPPKSHGSLKHARYFDDTGASPNLSASSENRGRKRQFHCVDKSPLFKGSVHSGLTQDISALVVHGDEHRQLKRSNSFSARSLSLDSSHHDKSVIHVPTGSTAPGRRRSNSGGDVHEVSRLNFCDSDFNPLSSISHVESTDGIAASSLTESSVFQSSRPSTSLSQFDAKLKPFSTDISAIEQRRGSDDQEISRQQMPSSCSLSIAHDEASSVFESYHSTPEKMQSKSQCKQSLNSMSRHVVGLDYGTSIEGDISSLANEISIEVPDIDMLQDLPKPTSKDDKDHANSSIETISESEQSQENLPEESVNHLEHASPIKRADVSDGSLMSPGSQCASDLEQGIEELSLEEKKESPAEKEKPSSRRRSCSEPDKPIRVTRFAGVVDSDSRHQSEAGLKSHTIELAVNTPVAQRLAQKDRWHGMHTPAAQCTPFRTPKSVRRGRNVEDNNKRILGTPDYLAPELLLLKEHGAPVDWWALGVCMFEFLTGVPPFNDDTPEQVFQNILGRDIPWPEDDEALSENCQNAINALLTFEPEERAQAEDLRSHPAFAAIEWDNLLEQTPQFVPNPDDEMDTTYFEARNNMQDLKVSGFDL